MRSLTDPRTYRPGPGEIPELPGVYRFSDPNGRVLYVGKAKNLRARLSNYFAPLDSLAERTRLMVTTATKVEWTVVATEYEALQLEFTWINEFEPPFNVQFRDDKSYPYLVVTLAEEAPRAIISRRTGIKGAKYFGPYPKVWAVKDTLELLYKVFPTRTCSDASYRKAMQTGKPCFPGQIGRCSGPCSGKVTIEEHREIVQQMVRFLSGRSKKLEVGLRRDMLAASADFDYERAAKLRDSLAAIQAVMAKSAVVLDDSTDTDVFGLAQDELSASIHQFLVRDGRIRGERSWVVTKEIDVETPELIEQLLETAYTIPESVVPARVLVPEIPVDAELVTEWLSTMRKAGGKRGGVTVATAQRGTKAALMDTATLNARNSLALFKTRRAADYVTRTTALEGIAEALGMRDAPLRIECFDVSHLSGTNIVASMVVFEDGLPRKNQYRRFSIENSADDTESIHQVITRRLARLEEAGPSAQLEDLAHENSEAEEDAPPTKEKFAYRPGLIIVDGGQPQVAAAARAMREAGVTDIALAGLAKRLEEVWLPDSDYPVILSRGSDALFMLQRLRDEAHRFAITFQRAKRKRDIRSELAEIPGLGAKRVSALLKHFGSVAALRGSDVTQVSAVPGIGTALAEIIVSTVNPDSSAD